MISLARLRSARERRESINRFGEKIAIGAIFDDDASDSFRLTHLDDAILRARCDDIVVVRAPGDVENGTLVASDERMIGWYATDLKWNDSI